MQVNNWQNFTGTSITTLILFCGVVVNDVHHHLQENKLNLATNNREIDYGINNDRYEIISHNALNDNDKIQIIQDFSGSLLEDIEDIPEEFAQAVDENIWDLI